MQICYQCHQYHADKQEVCNFCQESTLIDAEVPEELEEDCYHDGTITN